jgi:hypothetical protein
MCELSRQCHLGLYILILLPAGAYLMPFSSSSSVSLTRKTNSSLRVMTVLSLYCKTLLLLAVMASLVPVLDGAASFLIVEIEDTTQTTHTTHARKDTTHARKDTTLARKDTTHARKDTTHARKDTTHARKDTTHARKDTTHARKDTTHARKDTTHARKDTTLAKKETTPTRRSTKKGKYFKPTEASFLLNTLCFC